MPNCWGVRISRGWEKSFEIKGNTAMKHSTGFLGLYKTWKSKGIGLVVRENLETQRNQGMLEYYLHDFSNLKHPFKNMQCAITILCRKFSLQQPQQHRLVLLASGICIEI